MTDYKVLCAELLAELEDLHIGDTRPEPDNGIVLRARAALAEPEPDRPSDEEILELAQFHSVIYALSDGAVVSPFIEDTDMRFEVLSFARALLALSSRP